MRGSSLLHFLDRYFGVPLIFLLGIFRKKRTIFSLSQKPKIALLCTAAIGDTVLLSGIIADLRAHFPEAEMTFFVGPSNLALARLIPQIQVVPISVTSPWAAILKIRSDHFDLWIDCGQWPRLNALYSWFAKAKWKIGFKTLHQGRHWIYDQTVEHQMIHELENFRNLIRLLNVKAFKLPSLALEEKIEIQPDLLVLHLYAGGSRGFLKEWPQKNWVTLIDTLTARDYRICLTGGKEDALGCQQVRSLCQRPKQVTVASGKTSLRETALLLKSARAVISIDTGIMHLAAALGCPTIALHGPTASFRWGGVGPNVMSVVPSKGYAPCIHLGFETTCHKNHCMESIQIEQVLRALEILLSQRLYIAHEKSDMNPNVRSHDRLTELQSCKHDA